MLANATLADLIRPCEKKSAVLFDLALIIGGSFLVALSAQVAAGYPVPITAQTFAVLMLAALLGPGRAALCLLAYIAEGAAGLPVFAQGKAGFAALLGPTGGYLIGFVPAAYIVGFLARKGWDRRISTTILAMIFGNVIIYAFGLLWLSALVGLHTALGGGLYPFVPGDLLKIALAAAVLPSAWKLLERFGFTAPKK
jgi:biotin transport system substrate-specific component